jgi:polyisoprenoid-binding protein YceI
MKQEQNRKRVSWGAWLLVCILLLAAQIYSQAAQAPAPAPAQTNPGEIALNLDPAQSKLHWTLGSTLHTVHGTFNLKRGQLKFDPASGKASGEIVVYATSGESGNDGRDKKMHQEILESSRYPDISFRPDRIEGKAVGQGTCSVQLHGTFVLHGTEHELTVPVQAELVADHWKGSAKFSVPYIQWGLKSPNTFLLKADPTVDIELEMSGPMQTAPAR